MTRRAVWAGTLVAALAGGRAQADDCPQGTQAVVITEPATPSVNGQVAPQGVQQVECRPVQPPVGGSGTSVIVNQNAPQQSAPPASLPPTYAPSTASQPYSLQQAPVVPPLLTGVTILAGAGVEAYSGVLGSRVKPGAAWNILVDFMPSPIVGIELGYTGAANDLTSAGLAGVPGAHGPDIVRNGVQGAFTLGLTAMAIQPYVLGGIGVDHYDVRVGPASGFQSDTSGTVPVGGGIRAHMGQFTADARGVYDFTFDQRFASGVITGNNVGRYGATLNLGATF